VLQKYRNRCLISLPKHQIIINQALKVCVILKIMRAFYLILVMTSLCIHVKKLVSSSDFDK
jgi:hypothetical protein